MPKSKLEPEYYRSFTPSPGQYDVKIQDRTPGYSLGKSLRDALYIPAVPGPGAYSPERISDKKKLSIGKRLKYEGSSDSPGPGKYSPNTSLVLEKVPGAVFGTDRKLKNNFDETLPGPLDYDVNLSMSGAAKFSIPKASKDFGKHTNVPGPGHYNLSSTLGKAGLNAINKN